MAAIAQKPITYKPRVATGGTTAPSGGGRVSGQNWLGNGKQWAPKGIEGAPIKGRTSGPIKAGAPGAAPASSQPAGTAPMPWDGQYLSSVNNANAKYNNALISLGARRNAIQQDYGVDPGYNDYKANPYSRAALLEQSFQRANRGAYNSLAAQGQLYSGSSQNAETYNREHNAQERDALTRAYQAALQQNSDEGVEAQNALNSEIGAAGWKRLETAANAELEPETAPGKSRAKTKKPAKVKVGISNARKAR